MLKKLKKIFVFMVGLYALALVFEHAILLNMSDTSLKPSNYLSRVTANLPTPPVYLVSYADGHSVFYKNQNGQAISAINNGIDHIMMYKRRDIEPDFYHKNKEILDSKTGVGMWLWKPYFMLKTMAHAPENSIIIYADSPVVFKRPIAPLLDLFEKYDVLVLRDGARRKGKIKGAGQSIKREALELLNIDVPEFHKGDNLWACFLAVRNNANGRLFIEQWLKNCEVKDAIMNHPFNAEHQHPGYIYHSYEQSLLVAAAFQRPERLYVMDVDEAMKIFKNVHRHPNEEYKSLLPDMVKLFKISEWGYNSRWMQWLRKKFSNVSLS